MKSLKVINTILLSILLGALLSACGSDSDDDPVAGVQTGQFLDSAVEGLRYQTATQSGTTDQNGTFRYQIGETITLFLGEIELGSTTAGYALTPYDLTTNLMDPQAAAVKMAQLLQSLDNDGIFTDVINIPQAVIDRATGFTIDFEADLATLEGYYQILVNDNLASLPVGNIDAETHLKNTFNLIPSGSYAGTWTGDSGGEWTITVNRSTGTVSGSGKVTEYNGNPIPDASIVDFRITGTASTDGKLSLALSSRELNTTISAQLTGPGTGTWAEILPQGDPGFSGTFGTL